jgi:hypothetical protein
MRRLDLRPAQEPAIMPAQIVRQNKNHVRPRNDFGAKRDPEYHGEDANEMAM